MGFVPIKIRIQSIVITFSKALRIIFHALITPNNKPLSDDYFRISLFSKTFKSKFDIGLILENQAFSDVQAGPCISDGDWFIYWII